MPESKRLRMKLTVASIALMTSLMFLASCGTTSSLRIHGSILYIFKEDENQWLLAGYLGDDTFIHVARVRANSDLELDTIFTGRDIFYEHYDKVWKRTDELEVEHKAVISELERVISVDTPFVYSLTSIDESDGRLLLVFNEDDGHALFKSRMFIVNLNSSEWRELEIDSQLEQPSHVYQAVIIGDTIVYSYFASDNTESLEMRKL